MARRSQIVGAFIFVHAEGSFRGNQHLTAFTLDRLAENFFGHAIGIDIGGVKEVYAGFEADIHQARGLRNVAAAPRFKKFGAAAKRAGAETENGYF